MHVEAVIFDMDGVIVDSERYWEEEGNRIIGDVASDCDVSFADLTGMNVRDQYDVLTEQCAVSVDKQEFVDKYFERAETVYREKAELMDGFRGIVEHLHDDGVTVAVASSSFRDWIRMVLDRFDLDDLFAAVISAEDIDGKSKPAPDIYRHAADELGIDPAHCVVIEDSAHGVTAANEAGMYCVGFRTELNEGQDLSHADAVVDGAAGLQEFVQNAAYRDLDGQQ